MSVETTAARSFDPLRTLNEQLSPRTQEKAALERERDEIRKEMERYKEEVAEWKKSTTDKYQEAIKRYKAANYDYLVGLEEWKKGKEKEFQDMLAKAADELKSQKIQNAQSQEAIKAKEGEIAALRERCEKMELLMPSGMNGKNGLSLFTQMQNEVQNRRTNAEKAPASPSTSLKAKADMIQFDIASITIQQQKLEIVVKEGEMAKLTLLDLEKTLAQRRKDMTDIQKDMKAAKIIKEKKKQREDEIENRLSIVKDPIRRNLLIKKIVKEMVIPASANPETYTITSVGEEGDLLREKAEACGYSISLYPVNPIDKKRQGEPVADRYNLMHFRDMTIAALADGCGWGGEARDAAAKAAGLFIDFMKRVRPDISNTRQAVKFMLRAYGAAHQAIVEGTTPETLFSVGTTTMLGGMVLPLSKSQAQGRWAFVCVNIGDCKAYHYSASRKEVYDITGNRASVVDPRDPGGRLGPQLSDGSADLRNLSVYQTICDDNDILLILSDGIHDNIDPQHLGKTPQDFQLETTDGTWHGLVDPESANRAKGEWSLKLLKKMILGSVNSKSGKSKVLNIAETLVNYTATLTQTSRDFMENSENADKRLPEDYKKFPGKMDHSTCLVFQVGSDPLESSEDAPSRTRSESRKYSV
eukprot:TRINITY_DN11037_c1_g1_i1.p1 TRINITY_DN11037_c1_g1~~TRINITY_DN11037_c1_g1_i1.p1  ORF type:complete len:642 (+),score=207.30 TRINITY_DN11037_c1_g1_i1:1974-3899(+)